MIDGKANTCSRCDIRWISNLLKVGSNCDRKCKEKVVKGTLEGIKGQYLILDQGVLNIRKFAGYEVSFNTG